MDINLVSCSKCGHSVSQSAVACTYCGAVVSEEEPSRPSDVKIAMESAQPPEPAPPQPHEEIPAVIERPEATESAPETVPEPLEPVFSDLTPVAPAAMEVAELPKAAEPENSGNEVVIDLSIRSQFTENKPEASQESSEILANGHSKVAEASESVGIPPAVPEPLEPVFSDLTPVAPSAIEVAELPKAAEPENSGKEVVIDLSNRSQFTENKPEVSQESSEILADGHSKVAEASESVGIPPAVPEPLEPDFSDLTPVTPAAMEIAELPKAAEPENSGKELVIDLSNRSQFTENKPEAGQKSSEIRANAHSKVAETSESVGIPPLVSKPNAELRQEDIEFEAKLAGLTDNAFEEFEKLVESKKIPEKFIDIPEQDILNLAAEGHTAPEPLGPEILEIAEAGAQLSPETVPPVDKVAAQAPSSSMQGGSPAVNKEKKPEPKAATESEGSDEAILLTPNDEVNSPSKGVVDSGDETALKDTAEPIRDTNKAETDTKVKPPEDQANAKAEATPKPAEIQSPPKILKIERAAHDMWDALKKQKAVITKARHQKKAKLELARADAAKRKKEAVARYRALKKERKSQAGVEILKKEKPAGTSRSTKDHHRANDRGLTAKTKIVGLLNRYEGKAIGINYDNSAEIKEAKFVAANEEFFSVFVKEKELHYSYPLKTILTVVEGKDGVGGSDPQQKVKFNAVIKVQPFVL